MKNLVVEYLSERLGKVIFNTKKKQAYGPLYLAKILKDEDGEIYEEDLEHLVNVATNIILHKAADDPSGKKGEALLTHTAISIGVEVANFKRVELNKPALLHIGDLFIEAFYHSGFITIEIQEGFAPRSGSPYVIQITDKFSDLVQIKEAKGLILYSTGSMIPEIKNILQGDNLAVIKGINSEVSKIPLILHQQDFKQSIRDNAPWVQSLNRLQQQPWMVNRDVLKVIENNLDTILPEAKKRLDKAKKSDVDAAYKLLKEDPSEDNKESYNKAALEWNEELVVLRDISKRTELEAIFNKAKMYLSILSSINMWMSIIVEEYTTKNPSLTFKDRIWLVPYSYLKKVSLSVLKVLSGFTFILLLAITSLMMWTIFLIGVVMTTLITLRMKVLSLYQSIR